MFLVDGEIKDALRQDLKITVEEDLFPPFNPLAQIGASTIDLRLGRIIRKYKQQISEIDLDHKDETEIIEIPLDKDIIIHPGEFFMCLTVEVISLPANMAGIISPRSSIARMGLSVVDQIFIHPGYVGAIALQLTNKTDRPIKIRPLLAICQIMLLKSASYAEKGYDGRFSNETKIPRPPDGKISSSDREELIKPANDSKIRELQKSNLYHRRSRNLMNTVFLMIIAGCFPLLIQTFQSQPFPSATLTLSFVLILFSVTCLVVINWKK